MRPGQITHTHGGYPERQSPGSTQKIFCQFSLPDIDENLADQVTRIVRSVRQLDLKKHPSVSETIDWARTLVLLGIERIAAEVAADTANVLLKYRTDIDKAVKEFADNADELAEGAA